MNWTPIILSLQLAAVTTICLLIIGIPLVYSIHRAKRNLAITLDTFFTLPLVLPPSVLGFYLLLIFSPTSSFGGLINEYIGIDLVFSFTGLVIASIIYSLPFMLGPLLNGLKQLPSHFQEAAYTMGLSPFKTYTSIQLPNMTPAIIAAISFTFIHTIGEFGVVLMIGGSIPGKTEVASIALFNKVETLEYDTAHSYAITLVLLAFSLLLIANVMKNKKSTQI